MKAVLATCNLNQWSLDFEGNTARIIESIEIAKASGARYRLGPELEITGYSCEDHFLELDTLRHSWESLACILKGGYTADILCDIGMPVMHKNVRYNCRVFVLDGKLLLIRPKMVLASDGNYREQRWFVAWERGWTTEPYTLPREITELTGQRQVPIGIAAIAPADMLLAAETCEELFVPMSPHIHFGNAGVEIIANGSGSHHELRKLDTRIALIRNASAKNGGVYLYANQQGCDGGRLYFDGCALIAQNGEILAQGSQFSLKDVEVITATVNLHDVRTYRGAKASRAVQASKTERLPQIDIDFDVGIDRGKGTEYSNLLFQSSLPIEPHTHEPEEEIALGPACWLWDYLRRSGAAGYFIPLSGGADSGAVATLVGSMCQLVAKAVREKNAAVSNDVNRWLTDGETPDIFSDPCVLANRLLYTCYIGTENSSRETRKRAKQLAEEIGAHHLDINMDGLVNALQSLFTRITQKTPRFKVEGGTYQENQALQNIQARLRMVLSYLFAQMMPWVRGREGTLLVLGTGNVDEALRGYLTKYDCSSGDINPIGGISKHDLRRFLRWAEQHLGYTALGEIVAAPPTAELEPITDTYTQTDEDDMGMTYAELSRFGQLRKMEQCGPVSMFEKLVQEWDHLPPRQVAEKVKRFFRYYAINRHKMTTLTPAYHAESYSPDDNRFDLRQFLYNTRWTWQFRHIDACVKKLEAQAR
ncbi:NAD(+) synthase [Candidatus Poribacteria bacterium]|nr:MAG: NAD(+) synthase [Candidatus Poribacteria bacterium]